MPKEASRCYEQRVRLDAKEVAFLNRLRQKWGMQYPADALRHCIRRCMHKEEQSSPEVKAG